METSSAKKGHSLIRSAQMLVFFWLRPKAAVCSLTNARSKISRSASLGRRIEAVVQTFYSLVSTLKEVIRTKSHARLSDMTGCEGVDPVGPSFGRIAFGKIRN